MRLIALTLLGIGFIANAFYMFFFPTVFYDMTPGVAVMGPFNLHFIRDIALAFLVSGGCLLWASTRRDYKIGIVGILWPCLHAVFHVWIWINRGFPIDDIAIMNGLGIQAPAWLALFCLVSLQNEKSENA